jgi:hypothetical protein
MAMKNGFVEVLVIKLTPTGPLAPEAAVDGAVDAATDAAFDAAELEPELLHAANASTATAARLSTRRVPRAESGRRSCVAIVISPPA